MRVSSRFSLRTLLIVVAMVALTFGIATELSNRQGRDASALLEQRDRRRAAWHRAQRLDCERAIVQHQSYFPRDRDLVLRRAVKTLDIPEVGVPFQGWTAEATYHRFWAGWYAEQADLAARRRHEYQRRLLWPF